jgi:iron complex outermembrane receptor protein
MGGTAIRANSSDLSVFEAFVTGDTGFGFDAGNVVMAAGFQWQQTKYVSISDEVYKQGLLLGQGGSTPSVSGVIRVSELFIEGNIPLVADQAWAQMLALDLAYRYSDYNTSGGNSTYRVGIDWGINDMFRLRTGYNRAVRSPSVAELFSPQSTGLWWGVDPCSGESPDYTRHSALSRVSRRSSTVTSALAEASTTLCMAVIPTSIPRWWIPLPSVLLST